MNFDKITNRRGTNSVKWDYCPNDDTLPLWVADMDFETAPCIQEAVRRRAEHGIYGYVKVPDSYYKAVTGWFSHRHHWDFPASWIIYTTGVVPAISAIIQGLCQKGDKVLVQTPVYNCFFSSIRNSGCEVVASPLVRKDDTYVIDFDDLARKAADPQVKLMIICNPHNPAGRVWTEEELRRMGEICLANDVFVISDEIHNEFVMPGYRYTPYGKLGEKFLQNSAICVSPSKAFNIAGLKVSNIIVADNEKRAVIDKAINVNEICDLNPFAVVALEAAYSPAGGEWLDELVPYLYGNYTFLKEFFATRLPQFPVIKLEGTYLVWVDCSALGMDSTELMHALLDKQNVWFNAGNMYDVTPNSFMRINIACPRQILEKALLAFAEFCRK